MQKYTNLRFVFSNFADDKILNDMVCLVEATTKSNND